MSNISLAKSGATSIPKRRIAWGRKLFPFILLLPALLLFAVFTLYPVINGFIFSFMEWDGFSDGKWVGLSNYITAFHDPFVWQALGHNIQYAVSTVAGKVCLGLLLAILLNQRLKGISVYRTIIFIPVVLSFVAVGLLWSWIYNPVFGLLNHFLGLFGFSTDTAWLGDPKLALGALIVVDIWKWAGYHMVLFLAGLQNIPGDLYEAAKVDGASRRQSFFRITLPLMIPIIIINTTIAVMGAFNVFDLVYVMTSAGPYHATEVVMTYSYTQAFKLHSFGYGAAISYLLLFIIAVVTAIQLFIMKRFSH
ncbi:carbohydrate ABC transporter permease [Paenibacillus piri]|uniref:Sugar ABC transporter permease n=1 Tax=Paenibacillus piri TaxID=2547395 RepID=A0A4R5KIC4_9BACL|nr:sugar ABC transporter permease [Paenibacillus piri]TDF94842.1 sugar ABC transporter permease [Paenibacillus piri]